MPEQRGEGAISRGPLTINPSPQREGTSFRWFSTQRPCTRLNLHSWSWTSISVCSVISDARDVRMARRRMFRTWMY